MISKTIGFSGLAYFQTNPYGEIWLSNWKSPFFMGKSTISMAIFNSYFDITRGYLISSRRFLKISSCECNFCASCAWTFSSSNSSRSRSSSKSFCRSSPWRPGSCWMESPVEVWGKNWLDGFWMGKPQIYEAFGCCFLVFCHGQIWMKQSFSPCFKSLRPSQSPVAGDLFVQLPKHNGADGGGLRDLGPSENPGRDVLKPIRKKQIESISCRFPASTNNL